MIGLLITGHGHFASGLTSSLNLIAGQQQDYAAVDFPQEYSVEDLERDLRSALNTLAHCDGVLVLSDLAGGSPFKSAVICGVEYKNVQVIAGTNLPMLIEIAMARQYQEDLTQLAEMALTTGKEQIVRYEARVREEVEDFSDGI